MSTEELSSIYESLTAIKELCLSTKDCYQCPFSNSCICAKVAPKEWVLNDPLRPIFKFFWAQSCLRKPCKRLKFPRNRYRKFFTGTMLQIHKTKHSRKLDATGRLLIPMPLRKEYNIQDEDLDLYILQDTESNRTFLGIEVEQSQSPNNKINELLKTFKYSNIDELLEDISKYAQK